MTVYARSDIDFVTVSGAEHSHAKKKGDENMSVTCVVCEPELLKMGWATDVSRVELTPDEQLDLENAQHEIARFESLKIAENAREAAAAVRAAGRPAGRQRGSTR